MLGIKKMSNEKTTLEQIKRELERKQEFRKWSDEKNKDLLATPFINNDPGSNPGVGKEE